MTAAAFGFDLDELAESLAEIGRMFRAVLDGFAAVVRQVWPIVRRYLRRHGRGPYSNPAPLAIDGHAYARRLRARVRRR